MARKRTADFGSISHGTLRTEDLLEAFSDTLAEFRCTKDERKHVAEARRLLAVDPDEWTDEQQESADWLVNESLMDALQNHAPAYAYFGAHPGDGADFGFWLSEDFPGDEFDGLKVNDTADVPRGYSGEVLHVNDHGNTTLYAASRGRLREVWALV